jgi:hypothetical protein
VRKVTSERREQTPDFPSAYRVSNANARASALFSVVCPILFPFLRRAVNLGEPRAAACHVYRTAAARDLSFDHPPITAHTQLIPPICHRASASNRAQMRLRDPRPRSIVAFSTRAQWAGVMAGTLSETAPRGRRGKDEALQMHLRDTARRVRPQFI